MRSGLGARRSLKNDAKPGLGQAVRRSAKVVAVFVVICLLWSFWTSVSVDNWLAVMSVAGTASVVEIAVVFLILLAAVAIGVVVQLAGGRDTVGNSSRLVSIPHRAALIGSAAVVLIAFSFPAVNYRLDRLASTSSRRSRAISSTRAISSSSSRATTKSYWRREFGVHGVERPAGRARDVEMERPAGIRLQGQYRRLAWRRAAAAHRRDRQGPALHDESVGYARPGIRESQVARHVADRDVRFLVYGRSRVRMEHTFPWLLENRLNSEQNDSPHRETEILNFAVAGDSILQRVARLQKRALDFDIDAVVDVSVSGDTQLAVRGLRDAIIDRVPDLDPELLAIVDKAAVNRAMSKDEIERRLGPFAEDILRFGYRELATITRQNGVKAVVIVLPRLDDTDEQYRQEAALISALATEVGIEAIRLEGVYGTLNDRNSLKLASWDWHPNAQGHALLAARLYEELQHIGFATTSSRVGDSARQVGNGSLQ